MDGRSQVRQRDSIQLRQRELNCRTHGQSFQILENALDQIVMFSPSIPSNVRQNDPVVIQRDLLVFCVIFRHTFLIPQQIVNKRYTIL